MEITVTFDSLDEFNSYMGKTVPSAGLPTPIVEGPNREPAEEPQEVPQKATDEPDPITEEPEKPVQTDAEANPAPITEDFRIKVRKQLAALNRKTGFNRAAEIIKELTGANAKLTEVALTDLPKIMTAAEEELNAD